MYRINFQQNRLRFLLCSILLFLWTGCNAYDYAYDLPNGYKLIRTNVYTITIWHVRLDGSPDELVIPPKIVRMHTQEDIVMGEVELSPYSELSEESKPGYFVLNTKTGIVTVGMTKQDWLKSLTLYGITEEPKLERL